MASNIYYNIIFLLLLSCVENEKKVNQSLKDFVKIEIDFNKSNDQKIRANVIFDNHYNTYINSKARLIELYYTDIPPKGEKHTIETIKKVKHDFSVDLEKMIGEKFPIQINFKENEKNKLIFFIICDEYLSIDTLKNEKFNIKDEIYFTAEFNIKARTINLN